MIRNYCPKIGTVNSRLDTIETYDIRGDKMVEKELRFEILFTVNQLKSLLKESWQQGEIGQAEKNKIMDNLGQIKQIIYNDIEFKNSAKGNYSQKFKIFR